MDISKQYTDLAILSEIGERISRRRLDRNFTQAKLADAAGVSKRTIERLEKGESVQMTSFVQILRALGLVDHLDDLVPRASAEKRRKRASSVRAADEIWH